MQCLSGGQRQLVLIARALVQEAPLMFLDEPTSALDFKNQVRVWRLLQKISEHGITIFACSHDPNHIAWFCSHVVVFKDSGVIAQGAPNDVLNQVVLDQVYDQACEVIHQKGVKIVLPQGVGDTPS
jgi:iron complex transport system ATP-binding protein